MASGGDKLKQTARAALTNTQELHKMLFGLAARLHKLERKVNEEYFAKARIADWRSLAIMKLLDEQSGEVVSITEKMVCNMAEKLQIEDFEEDSAKHDGIVGIISCDDETAAKGHFAIGTMSVFKDGVELEEQKIVRTKFEIGIAEHFPEVDEAVKGLKVGESKRFSLNLSGKTDEAEFFLTGLRKRVDVQKQEERSHLQ